MAGLLSNLLGLGGDAGGSGLSGLLGLGGTQDNTSGAMGLGNATDSGGGLLGLNLFGVDNSMRLPLALSMLGGGSNSGAFTNAANVMANMGPKLEEKRLAQAQQNKTLEFLKQNNPELAQMVDAGMPINEAWNQVLKSRQPGSGVSYSKTPVYGTVNGKTVLGTVGEDGSFKQIDTGEFQPSSGFDRVDLGTGIGIVDRRTGQVVQTIPKDNYGAAYDTGSGTADAKTAATAREEYASIASKMPGLRAVIGNLDQLAEKATYTLAGQGLDEGMKQLGMEPREAAVARTEYIAIVDNQVLPLLRDTFGAQFTVEEGKALRATLGDPNKTPAQKQAVLKAFIEQKERDLAALASRAGMNTPAAPGASPAAADPLGIR